MKNIYFTTLAAIRDVDPETFDRKIFECVQAAADQVGKAVVIEALCAMPTAEQFKKAA
jgi:hypothetical protein